MNTIIREITPNAHCSTICVHGKGVLLAYYSGPECSNAQKVWVEYWEDGVMFGRISLPNKTGNCLLVPAKSKEATLIFSDFHDTDGIDRPAVPVERWRFCTNWKCKVTFDKKLKVSTFERFNTPENVGYLVRCQAINYANKWYLPMYREHDVLGQIFESSDGYNWKATGKIGEGMECESRFGNGVLIQPTIWIDQSKKMHSLSRDVSSRKRAWYSVSTDLGKTWSKPESSKLWNDNNSIVVCNDFSNSPWTVWNHGNFRNVLMLGKLNNQEASQTYQLNKKPASYPNYCFDQRGQLNIVHTEDRKIMWHMIDKRELDKLHVKSISNKSR